MSKKISIFSTIKKVLALFLMIATCLSIQSSLSVTAHEQIKQESFVTINYSNTINLEELRNRLSLDIKNYDTVLINNLSASINIGNQNQTFSLNNEAEKTGNFLRNYIRQNRAFIPTLLTIQQENKQDESYKAIVSKYSRDELKNANKNKSDIRIKSLTISGSNANINKIKQGKTSFGGNVEYFKLAEIQAKAEQIEKKLSGITNPDEKLKVIQQEIQTNFIQNNQKVAPVIDLNQNQIQEVDKQLSRDLNGGLFVDNNKIKPLGLTDNQISSIKAALTNYNQIPLEEKDGSNQAITSVVQSTTMQKELQKQDTILDKADMIINGSVDGKAWTYWGSNGFNIQFEWWGYGVKVPSWAIAEMEWHLGNWGLSNAINLLIGFGIAMCGPYIPYCTAAAVILYLGYWGFTWYNRSVCGSNGVRIWKSYASSYFYSFSC
jgi:hypothetical protein